MPKSLFDLSSDEIVELLLADVSLVEGKPLKLDQSTLKEYGLLIEKWHTPPSHRTGLIGRITNFILGKLSGATKAFLTNVLLSQQLHNEEVVVALSNIESKITEIDSKFAIVNRRMNDLEILLKKQNDS